MNSTELTYLLNKPNAINARQIEDLDKILVEYPYFQSARSLNLKGLFNQNSFRYNETLKKVAAYTTDRSILFEFITNEDFVGIQKGFFEEKQADILNISVNGSIIVDITKEQTATKQVVNTLEESILLSIEKSNLEPTKPESSDSGKTITEILEIEKPLVFEKNEKHSFQEWLQISQIKPISRAQPGDKIEVSDSKLLSKLDIIDKFIENNPKISPVKKNAEIPVLNLKPEDNSYLMTETLAKVYLEQKKYSKAIQAFEILILKYPEKNAFFADRISLIKELQKNNS